MRTILAYLTSLKTFQYLGLAFVNNLSIRRLKRIPEPHNLTESNEHVEDYSRAIDSVMILPYVLVLDFVHQISGNHPVDATKPKKAVDLCCGPGHFTRLLAKTLNCNEVIGVDLSEPMLKKAQEAAKKEQISDRLKYLKCDVTALNSIETHSTDIVTFMDGAHHMNSLQQVTQILKEADRVAKPEGVIVLMDPVRPKTHLLAKLYHRIAGKSYLDLDLPYFNKDFYDSILASWTTDEMFGAIPKDTTREWIQFIPFGFPSLQIIVGLPKGRRGKLANPGLWQKKTSSLIAKEWMADWRMLKFSILLATRKKMVA